MWLCGRNRVMTVCIEIKNLDVESVNRYKILDNISLSINCGDFVIVTGPSGGGKSTFIKILTGVLETLENLKISGYVNVAGVNVLEKGFRELVGKIGVVFQNPVNEIFSLTVEEEIAFPLENMNLSPDEIRERVDRVLKILDIYDIRKKFVYELSMGQIQRVVLASTLAMEPYILLMDEPCAYIDPGSKQRFYDYVYRYWRNKGATIIVVDHDLDYILSFATKLLVLNKKIIAYGDPIDVLSSTRIEEYGVKEPVYVRMCRNLGLIARNVEEVVKCLKTTMCRDK